MAESTVLHIRFPNGLLKQLTAYAQRIRRGRADCVRIIVEDRIAEEQKKAFQQKAERKP